MYKAMLDTTMYPQDDILDVVWRFLDNIVPGFAPYVDNQEDWLLDPINYLIDEANEKLPDGQRLIWLPDYPGILALEVE